MRAFPRFVKECLDPFYRRHGPLTGDICQPSLQALPQVQRLWDDQGSVRPLCLWMETDHLVVLPRL